MASKLKNEEPDTFSVSLFSVTIVFTTSSYNPDIVNTLSPTTTS